MQDGAAVTGLVIAAASLVAVNLTGNPIYDPIGSIIVGNLLGVVHIFIIHSNILIHCLIKSFFFLNFLQVVKMFK